MADDEVKKWMEENCPQVLRTYERSKIPFESLVPGTTLITLRAGYGGYCGLIKKVISEIQHTDGAPIIKQLLDGENPYYRSTRRYVVIQAPHEAEAGNKYHLYEDDRREGPWYFQVALIDIKDYEVKGRFQESRRKWELENLGCSVDEYFKLYREK